MRAGVPHDGVDDLQPLSGHGLEGLVVTHAALAACIVVAAELAFRADERVAREDGRVL